MDRCDGSDYASSRNYWNHVYESYDMKKVVSDDWLDSILEELPGASVLDLGCGSGNDTQMFLDRGMVVTACDQSEVAIAGIRKKFPGIKEALVFNMLEKFLFEDDSYDIVCADLSLHYFTKADTDKILGEIKRVLKNNGQLLVRVNSVNDVNFGAGVGEEIEHHLYKTEDGMLKRFFDENDVREIFKDFSIDYCKEGTMNRYSAPKQLYTIKVINKKYSKK